MKEERPGYKLSRRESDRDLDIASRVHYSLIPRIFSNDFLDIAIEVHPFYKLGGDYASIISKSPENVVINVSDVMGHGVTSALLAGRINSFVLDWCYRMRHPCEVIDALNDFIFENFYEFTLFATFFSVFIDKNRQEFQFAGGGHPPAIFCKKSDRSIRRLPSSATIVGAFKPMVTPCDITSVKWDSGDKLVIYTDGLIDLKNPSEEIFGIDRLEEIVLKHIDLPPSKMASTLLEASKNTFQGEPTDDILVAVTEFK